MDQNPYGWWLPVNASAQGAGIDQLINILHWFMAVLFFGWGIYLVYCLIRFRERPGHKATVVSHHFKVPTWLEVGIALIEVVLLVFISSPIWFRVKNQFPQAADALTIRVIAEQFAWNVHYPGPDGKFGKTDPTLMAGDNPIGIDRTDPEAKDDIVTINVLHIPVGKPVIAHLTSKDVIHNFFLPVLRVKQDVLPGMSIPIWFQADRTVNAKDKEGNPIPLEIGCAQLCGLGHYRMRGSLSIDTPEQFQAWVDEEEKNLKDESSGNASTTPAEGKGKTNG
jgi:cytochrome c oxidase subunit II